MKLKDSDYSFYAYGIKKLEIYKNNPKVLELYFGNKDIPFRFHRSKLPEFLKSVLPDYEVNVKQNLNLDDDRTITYANGVLKGRSIVVVTNLKDFDEYFNILQNRIIGFTCVGIDGRFKARDRENLFYDNLTLKELNPDFLKPYAENKNIETEGFEQE